MKKYIVFIIFCLTAIHGYSQVEKQLDKKMPQKLTKEQKQEKQKAEKVETARLVDKMIQQKKFVLEADYISTQTGRRVIVNGQLNFIRVDSSRIIIQIAPNTVMFGSNGLGGITADGLINKWELKRFGKNQQLYSINLSVYFTRAGYYDIVLTVNPNGSTQAVLSGPDAAKIMFYGRLIDIRKSKVFKGNSI
ncbi:MAG: DUF4251 domain-containing protein [Bacteroidales bacterium]|nr:DUF4251 domain-containing protein [Bacteroidales bacterium]